MHYVAKSALCLIALAAPAAAQGQTFVRADCRAAIGAPPTRFDDQGHRQWYRRFWDGNCGGLSFCMSGSPNWNDAVGEVLRKAPLDQRTVLRSRACRLGKSIGFEWARANSIRRINTSDLEGYVTQLNTSSDVAAALDLIDESTKAKLAAR